MPSPRRRRTWSRRIGQRVRRWSHRVPGARPVVDAIARLLQLDDSPESIARGVALGLFVAFTPTVGIQMVIVLVVNTLARANRLAGLAMVWLTNPVTVVPVYWWNYTLGVWLLGRRSIGFEQFAALFDLHSSGLLEQFLEFSRNLAALGLDVALPLVVGGCVTGLVLGVVAYPIVLVLVRKEREALAHLRALRERRKRRWHERERGGVEREEPDDRPEALLPPELQTDAPLASPEASAPAPPPVSVRRPRRQLEAE